VQIECFLYQNQTAYYIINQWRHKLSNSSKRNLCSTVDSSIPTRTRYCNSPSYNQSRLKKLASQKYSAYIILLLNVQR